MDIVDKVAEAIYRHDGGVDDEEFLFVNGKPRRVWKTDKPWDPEHELCEHERDDYRAMARAAIQAMQQGKAC